MAQTVTPLPFGLRDVKIKTFTAGTETPAATGVDLPNSRTFSFSEAESFEELRGDDGLVAVHGTGAAVDWSLEGGGVSFEVVKAMYGGTIVETGTTPAQIKTYSKKGKDQRPYFQAEGQAISDSGGDFHVIVYKCRATGELSGELSDGSFWLTGASGRGLPLTATDKLYDFIQNETAISPT
jgi:hypothetical protein